MKDKEIWKDIVGYEGLYQISNWGRIKSLNYRHTGKESIRKPTSNKGGYLQVDLWKDGKIEHLSIHRLVAMHFLDVPDNYKEWEVNHKDEDKTNNCADNLEWCTRDYNLHYSSRLYRVDEAKKKPVVCIDNGTIYPSIQYAEEFLQIPHHVGDCCRGKRKKCGGLRWQFLL